MHDGFQGSYERAVSELEEALDAEGLEGDAGPERRAS